MSKMQENQPGLCKWIVTLSQIHEHLKICTIANVRALKVSVKDDLSFQKTPSTRIIIPKNSEF